jgi:hypothetical protein
MAFSSNMLADAVRPASPGVAFKTTGALIVGKITHCEETEVPDLNDKSKMVPKVVITIEAIRCEGTTYTKTVGTIVTDEPCVVGETYNLYCSPRSNLLRAICEAAIAVGSVNAKGEPQLEEGAMLGVQYTGDGERKQAGHNPPKLYGAQYQLPVKATAVVGGLL